MEEGGRFVLRILISFEVRINVIIGLSSWEVVVEKGGEIRLVLTCKTRFLQE